MFVKKFFTWLSHFVRIFIILAPQRLVYVRYLLNDLKIFFSFYFLA
jgi:hypothetical protein